MRHLPPSPRNDQLIVGTETFDDAGVYRLTDDIALVQTLDFFTPVVDDPRQFGRIAAANALSDIYAMGATPLTALNLVGFPSDTLPMRVLAEILSGGGEQVQKAGATLVGGHTVVDPEPKYGLSVTGTVHPSEVWTNAGAQPGDVIYLTKPLGIGVITTALKNGAASPAMVEQAIEVMASLNDRAKAAGRSVRVHACTDVTGFGFLGHLYEMAAGSRVNITVHADQVPVIEGTFDLVSQGFVCGGSRANLRYLSEHVYFHSRVAEPMQIVLADAITSGGLLLAVPATDAAALEGALAAGSLPVARVAEVSEPGAGRITVTP